MQARRDRRSCPRVAARANSARLGWDAAGRGAEIDARIVDISRSGALVEAEGWRDGPPSAWVRIVGPARTGRVPVGVVRRAAGGRVAVAFEGPCPTELLLSATLGLSFEHLLGGDAGDGRSRDDWTFGA
ncbi:MAG TPA: hypothetical protein VGH33_11055 [Isosphaeraceae bacterium]